VGGTPSTPAVGVTPAPAGSFVVTAYGADPTGRTDSSLAIRGAIEAASSKGGWQTVYFPAGTYLLNRNDGKYQDFVLAHVTVNILGAGRDSTKIVEKVGTYAYPNLKRGKTVFVFSHMRGFYISGLTIDAQTYNAGDTVDDYGDNSTVEHLTLLGAKNGSGGTVDRNNVFDLRVLAVCGAKPSGPLYGVYHSGNVVNDIILNGKGIGANDDLDFSCERNGRISNIVDTGWGTAIYLDSNVAITNYTFRPGGTRTAFRGFFITDSHDITINSFTTYGEGGIINSASYPSSNITIDGEHMMSANGALTINDATDVTIKNSVLGSVVVAPRHATDGLTVENTTYRALACKPHPGARVVALTGARCS
jgi:hypothetical protein